MTVRTRGKHRQPQDAAAVGKSFATVGGVGLVVTVLVFAVLREPVVLLSAPAFVVFLCVGVYLVLRQRRPAPRREGMRRIQARHSEANQS